ncbi:hypothetical protein D3C79_833150 [compost metagenome]
MSSSEHELFVISLKLSRVLSRLFGIDGIYENILLRIECSFLNSGVENKLFIPQLMATLSFMMYWHCEACLIPVVFKWLEYFSIMSDGNSCSVV